MVVGLVLSQALYGAGVNTFVMVVEGLLHFGVLVPVSWLLGPGLGFGLEGIWLAAALYMNLMGLAMGAQVPRPGLADHPPLSRLCAAHEPLMSHRRADRSELGAPERPTNRALEPRSR